MYSLARRTVFHQTGSWSLSRNRREKRCLIGLAVTSSRALRLLIGLYTGCVLCCDLRPPTELIDRCNQSGASVQGTPGKPRWRSIIVRRRRHGTPPHPQRCRSEKSYGNIDHVFPSTATTISSHSNGNRNGRCSSEHKRSLFLTTADDAWRFLQGENKGMNSEVIFRM